MDTEKYWRERCEGLLGVLKVVFYATVKPEENPIVEWEKFLERNNYKELYEQLKSTPIPLTPCVLPLDNDQPFNTRTVIETLIWASEHLLHEKNYDGGSVKGIAYEEIERCVVRAKDILTRLIQTPCVELEKEVERLKGLISVALTTDPPRTIDEINKFKTEYNL